MIAPDGGPAFPGFEWQNYVPGMTLRDWFAGQALNGMLSNGRFSGQNTDEVTASVAYQYADAMLAERAKGAK